jgi:hypothetical protein
MKIVCKEVISGKLMRKLVVVNLMLNMMYGLMIVMKKILVLTSIKEKVLVQKKNAEAYQNVTLKLILMVVKNIASCIQ